MSRDLRQAKRSCAGTLAVCPIDLHTPEVRFTRASRTKAKEGVGGYWIIQVKSREEALEWASRLPGKNNEMVEVRRTFELTNFLADVREKFEKFQQEIAEGGNETSEQ